MRYKYLVILVMTAGFFSCKKEKGTSNLQTPPPLPPVVTAPTVLLKDVISSGLPSPYYHFEYNAAGNVSFVSFASDFTRYDVIYDGGRISEMRNNIIGNKDRVQYFYDNSGRVNTVRYVDSTGIVFARINLMYDGPKLIELEREQKSGASFMLDKTVTMSYYPDGNLMDFTVHYSTPPWRPESNYSDHYEQYDNKISAENFNLLHDEFFDHFVFLPGIQLQKNNPGKVTHTNIYGNSKVEYTYTYNDQDAPLTRSGNFIYTSGSIAGQGFQLSSVYTYY